ncbi:MAG: hypothetical protein JJU11_08790, partial [Candidatus Sumerlaeia bacterium]|nr:hypothetical protein [Candidatus Sumerlaeia bacterium]
TTPPPAPSTPDLLAADDSGRSNNDNVTTFTLPRFEGTSEEFAFIELVDIFAPGQPVIGVSAPDDAGPDGIWLAQVTNPLADGDYLIAARAVDIAGNVGPLSDFLLVTIDTTPPDPPVLTGIANPAPVVPGCAVDNLTSGTSPLVIGTAEDAAFIRFFDSETGLQVGFGASVGGDFTIGTISYPEGMHSIVADATDVAGNVSALSDPLTFTIDTEPPAVVLIDDDTETGTPAWRVAESIPVRLVDFSNPTGFPDDDPFRLYVRHEYFDPVVSNGWQLVGTFDATGVIDYTPAFGRGRYYFHVTANDCAGNSTGIPSGNSGTGQAQTIYNPVPNSRLVLDVPAGATEVFPMTNTTRVYIDYTNATPQGFVSVLREDEIPFGFESTVFIKESLNIQGAFDGAATLTWHYHPSSPEDLTKPIDRVYRFEGGTRTLYPGAPGSTAFFQRDENWLRVTGIDSFSWWYAGNDPAITTIDDWLMY